MDTPRITPITEPLAPSIKERLDRILPLLPPGLSAPQIYLTVARNEGLFNHIVDIISGTSAPQVSWTAEPSTPHCANS
jgi:hypothetical protein